MTDVVVKCGWENGPWSLRHFNAPAFTIGTSLNDTCVEEWARLNIQSGTGQVNAIEIEMARFEKQTGTKLSDDEWAGMLVACGLWASVRDKTSSCLMLTALDIEELNTEFNTNLTFRHDLALASSKDPPMDKSAAGDIAGWLLGQVSEMRRAKDQSNSRAKVGTEALPSKTIGDKDAVEFAAFNYFSALLLDVKAYKMPP